MPRPPSPHCSDIAPQTLTGSFARGFGSSIRSAREPSRPVKRSTIRWPPLRVGVFLPTSMLPLPTTRIPFECIATRGCSEMLQIVRSSRPERLLRVTVGEAPSRFSTRERLKIRPICRTRGLRQARFDQQHSTGIIDIFRELFRRARATKQISRGMKPFCALAQTSGNSPWLTTVNENGGQRRRPKPETVK